MTFIAAVLVLGALFGFAVLYAAALGEAHQLERDTGQECDVELVRLWPAAICRPEP